MRAGPGEAGLAAARQQPLVDAVVQEGRFSRAVLTHQGMNFAFLDIESGILQGNLARKRL